MATDYSKNVNRRVRATGAKDSRKLIAQVRAAFPDAKFSLAERVRDDTGDIAYVWSVTGTNTGEVEGLRATGARANIVVVTSIGPGGDTDETEAPVESPA